MFWREKLKSLFNNLTYMKKEHGAIFILTAVLLPVLFGFLGVAYDVGNLYMHKAHLQNTADAAALAGGRKYINELDKKKANGKIELPTTASEGSTSTQTANTVRSAAKALMVKEANHYITNNKPLFDGVGEKVYSFGTMANGTSKSTEYFKVELTEPVQVYFMPVLGVQDKANVYVYATTKLSETEKIEGNGSSFPDAEYKPVVITEKYFYDLKNGYEGERNYYNGSNVYIGSGGEIGYDSGTIYSKEDKDGNNVSTPLSTSVIEKDYEMARFGDSIKQLFRTKQKNSLSAEDKAKYIEYEDKKAEWHEKYREYLEAYNTWITSGTPSYSKPTTVNQAKNIYNRLVEYYNICDAWKVDNNSDAAKAAVKAVLQKWENDGKPLVGTETDLLNLIKDNSRYNIGSEPNTIPWEWLNTNDVTKKVGVLKINGAFAPSVSDYTGMASEPEIYRDYGIDEYYMTYNVKNAGSYDTMTLSSSEELSGPERSYVCFSLKNSNFDSGTGNGNVNITINGFYPDVNTKSNAPFYILMDETIQTVNLYFTANCNRPIIFCYFGSEKVHMHETADGTNYVEGIFYMPNCNRDSFSNWSNVTFLGSIIGKYWHFQNGRNNFKYDTEKIKSWMELKDANGRVSEDALPVSPNTGFADSSSIVDPDESTVDVEKITLVERLRLILRDSKTDESHYDEGKVNWTLLPTE